MRLVTRYTVVLAVLTLTLWTIANMEFPLAAPDDGWTPIKYYKMLWVEKMTTVPMRPEKSSVVDMMNEYRRRNGVSPLVDDEKLKKRAQACADFYAARGEIVDNSLGTLHKARRCSPRETDFMFVGPKGDIAWLIHLKRWYKEMESPILHGEQDEPIPRESYDFRNPNVELLPYYRHFTQMVWRGSKRVGCATSRFTNGKNLKISDYISLCLFEPRGNVVHGKNAAEYIQNVLPPLE